MPTRPAKAYLVHRAPGRMRFRIPERRHDAAFFAEIQTRLGKCTNVRDAQVNPLTSGILVHFTGTLDALIAQAHASGLPTLLEFEMSPPPLSPLADRLREQASRLDEAVKHYTGGETDARSLALLGLLAAGIMQFARGEFLGPSVPLLWYASQVAAGTPAPGKRRAAAAKQRTTRSDQGGEQS